MNNRTQTDQSDQPDQPALDPLHMIEANEDEAIDPLDEKTIKKHARLWRFPTANRTGGYLAKIIASLLLGAATIGGIITTFAPIHILIACLIIGSVYTVKTIRESYKKHKKEKKLMQALETNFKNALNEFSKLRMGDIEVLVTLFEQNPHKFTETQKQKMYTRLVEYQEALTSLKTLVAGKKKSMRAGKYPQEIQNFEKFLDENKIEKRMKSCLVRIHAKEVELGNPQPQLLLKDQYRQRRAQTLQPAPAPQDSAFKQAKKFLQRWGGKTFNRLIDFLGGASTGFAVSSCVLTCVVGGATAGAIMSNPLGWIMLALFAAGALVGLLSVLINYTITRGQDSKIDRLTVMNDDLSQMYLGLQNIREHTKRLRQFKEAELKIQTQPGITSMEVIEQPSIISMEIIEQPSITPLQTIHLPHDKDTAASVNNVLGEGVLELKESFPKQEIFSQLEKVPEQENFSELERVPEQLLDPLSSLTKGPHPQLPKDQKPETHLPQPSPEQQSEPGALPEQQVGLGPLSEQQSEPKPQSMPKTGSMWLQPKFAQQSLSLQLEQATPSQPLPPVQTTGIGMYPQ